MLLPVDRAAQFFARLQLPAPLDEATELLLAEIRARLGYLREVGLGYLTLDRQSRTLSGGEVQRINLTTALGTSLVNTLFVLDEPSIGLHPRDMGRVIGVMKRLRDAGNSLVVVEHDPQIMLEADACSTWAPAPASAAARSSSSARPRRSSARAPSPANTSPGASAPTSASRRRGARPGTEVPNDLARDPLRGTVCLAARGAEHNLKNIDVELPAAPAGVRHRRVGLRQVHAGPGRAAPGAAEAPGQAHGIARRLPRRCADAERVNDVVFVDQSPIGRTTRSNPASYVGAFDAIRELFAAAPDAKARGYTAGTFSFNSGNGRCPTCSGNGFEHVEMQFLSDVYLRCPDCNGTRYRDEVLEVTRGTARSIAEVLELTVARGARRSSPANREVRAACSRSPTSASTTCASGQPVPTLSGGEAQRLKLAGHLAEAAGRSIAALPRRPRDAGPAATADARAVPLRRAHHRTALRRRRQAARRVPPADRRGPLAGRDRAQPRRDPRRRLDRRPRPRGRRSGRRNRRAPARRGR